MFDWKQMVVNMRRRKALVVMQIARMKLLGAEYCSEHHLLNELDCMKVVYDATLMSCEELLAFHDWKAKFYPEGK